MSKNHTRRRREKKALLRQTSGYLKKGTPEWLERYVQELSVPNPLLHELTKKDPDGNHA